MELPGYDNWKLGNGYSDASEVSATVTIKLTDIDGEEYTADFDLTLDRDVADDYELHHDTIMDTLELDINREWEQHPGQKYEIVDVTY